MDFCLVFFGVFFWNGLVAACFNLCDDFLSGCHGIGLFVFPELGFFLANGTLLVFFFGFVRLCVCWRFCSRCGVLLFFAPAFLGDLITCFFTGVGAMVSMQVSL